MGYSVTTIVTILCMLGATAFGCLNLFHLWQLGRALAQARRLQAELDELRTRKAP